jgi:hypothetical protein
MNSPPLPVEIFKSKLSEILYRTTENNYMVWIVLFSTPTCFFHLPAYFYGNQILKP